MSPFLVPQRVSECPLDAVVFAYQFLHLCFFRARDAMHGIGYNCNKKSYLPELYLVAYLLRLCITWLYKNGRVCTIYVGGRRVPFWKPPGNPEPLKLLRIVDYPRQASFIGNWLLVS